jgi:hypothetical protein
MLPAIIFALALYFSGIVVINLVKWVKTGKPYDLTWVWSSASGLWAYLFYLLH